MSMEINRHELCAIIDRYPAEKRFALAIMQDLQQHYQFVPREGLEILADHIGTPLIELYSMATFYKAIKLVPRGKHIIKACDGTACHIKGSTFVLDSIWRMLHIGPGETTADGCFSLETVNCLGACAISPVIVIDDEYFSKMTNDKIVDVINRFKESGDNNG